MTEKPNQSERPGGDTAAGMVAWMAADFTTVVTEGLSDGIDADEDSDHHE